LFLLIYLNTVLVVLCLDEGVRAGVPFWNVTIQTLAFPCFTILQPLFYNSLGKKILPSVEIISELLTPVALAHWIMGDGSVRTHGLVLCTESFSVQEVVLLANILLVRYGLNCTLHARSNFYRINIRASSIQTLRTIVLPYRHTSILYKLKPKGYRIFERIFRVRQNKGV